MTNDPSWLIGNNSSCDLVVDGPGVAARHCRLTKSSQGFQLCDLNTPTGTFVNGRRIAGTVSISPRDVITLGSQTKMPWPPRMRQSVRGNAFTFKQGVWTLGRDDGCDWIVDWPSVSRRHARLHVSSTGCIVEDLASANGTFLNGRRLSEPTAIKSADVVTFGTFAVRVTNKGLHQEKAPQNGLVLEIRDLRFDAGTRCLLDEVSLTIFPGEFVGLMGPSGAGKTTLMSMMNGYAVPSHGEVLVNGHDLYADFARFSTMLGYVPQDDIIHRELTVYQALYYTARLRLPSATAEADIQQRVATAIKELGLTASQHTLIGSPDRKGISGGQRKRVNLAMELLTEPAVLFLDEPTSGLSSEDALRVMKLLRSLANSGRTILLTIHQPSLQAYQLLDHLVLLGKEPDGVAPAQLVYYGPAYPDALRFLNPAAAPEVELSAEDIFHGMQRDTTAHWRERYMQSDYRQKFDLNRRGVVAAAPVADDEAGRVSLIDQAVTLFQRSLSIKSTDRWNTAILLIQAPIVAIIIVLVFGSHARQRITLESWPQVTAATAMTVFLTSLSALWFGCSNAVREIVGEWTIYRRERMVNLRIPAYILSKLLIGMGLCCVQCAILVAVVRFGCELRAPLFSSFAAMMLIASTGLVIGLLISAIARTSEVAIGLLPLALIPMVVLGGGMLPVQKMNVPIRLLAYCLPLRSAFESELLLESNSRPLGPSAYSGVLAFTPSEDDGDRVDLADGYFPKARRSGILTSIGFLAAMFVVLVAAIHLVLLARDIH